MGMMSVCIIFCTVGGHDSACTAAVSMTFPEAAFMITSLISVTNATFDVYWHDCCLFD